MQRYNYNLLLKATMMLITLSSFFKQAYSQQKITLSGTITSAKTGETLIGSTVQVDGTGAHVTTNEYGFYSISVPKGSFALTVSYVGYERKYITALAARDSVINIKLEDEGKVLEAVTITSSARGRNLSTPQMGVERLSIAETKNIPVLFGEKDILKVIQLLPGIKSAGDGNSGFYVRGGAADQNLVLLDEAPIYNASHALGFFSTFNSDAIKDIMVYKGGMPAQYGGRLSSVVDVKMNDGNNQDFGVSGGVGLISAKLNVEGPVQKGKSSFLVSARRTYVDAFLRLSSDSSINSNSIYFYDFNVKFNYYLGKKDRLYFSGYLGRDELGIRESFKLNWGNTSGTLRWNHIFSNKLFSNTSLIYSNYDYNVELNISTNDFNVFSQIRDWNLKQEFQWYANPNNTVRFGANAIYHQIRPGEITASASSSINSQEFQNRFSLENSLFASNTWKVSEKFSLAYGMRLSMFSILGAGDFHDIGADGSILSTQSYKRGEVVKTYVNPEPRIAASYTLNSSASVKASYARNVQNLHLIANSTTSTPTDKWAASSNMIKPEISDQFSIGYYRDFGSQFELTVESYYKSLQNQIDYRDGADVLSNEVIESQLLYGRGRAYGIEWMLKKKTGRFTGWLSYTLSRTERQIDGINNNEWYNARQNRTHDIAIVGMYKLNEKWTLSANWIFYNGDAVTFPNGRYRVDNQTVYYYTKRNDYRMPNYSRLDLGATMQLAARKKYSSELNFSLYNAYGRENAYTIAFRDSKEVPGQTETVRTSLFRFIPSVAYNFKF